MTTPTQPNTPHPEAVEAAKEICIACLEEHSAQVITKHYQPRIDKLENALREARDSLHGFLGDGQIEKEIEDARKVLTKIRKALGEEK